MNKKTAADIHAHTADELKNYLLAQCAADTNMMDPSYYRFHISFVEHYSLDLAPLFGADKELVRLAALAHDLGAICDYSQLATHHLVGAEMAAELLVGKISGGDIQRIADAIRSHNMPTRTGSPEAVTLSHADALSKFDAPVYWLLYAWKRKFSSIDESLGWYRNLLATTYEMMAPEAQRLIDEKYSKVKLLLSTLDLQAFAADAR
jgi:hypothetical protein